MRAMKDGAQQTKPLATSRPWLSVAGCLGGGALTALFVFLVIVAIALYLLWPRIIDLTRGPETKVLQAIGELRKAPALKVADREIAVRIEHSVPREWTVRPWMVPIGPGYRLEVGRTTVAIDVPENRVQYIVPFDGEMQPKVAASADGKLVIVTMPPPRVDARVVEVQSDPARLRVDFDRDWLNHILPEGEVRDEALAMIRARVVETASAPSAIFEVREKARETVAEMIRALLPPRLADCDIVVRWSDEDAVVP